MVKTPIMFHPRMPRHKRTDISALFTQYLHLKDLPVTKKRAYLRHLRHCHAVYALPLGRTRFLDLKHFYTETRAGIQRNHQLFVKHYQVKSDGHLFKSLSRLQQFYLKVKHHLMQRKPLRSQPLF